MLAIEKPKVVWDIDDVKACTTPAIIDSANATFGLQLTASDFSEDFTAMIGQPQPIVKEWWLSFCDTEFPRLRPTVGMFDLMVAYRSHLRHDQLTSRREVYRGITEAWTRDHYPGIIGQLHIARIEWDDDPQAHLKTKTDDLRSIEGAKALIDDQKKHCLSVAHAGFVAIRFCESEARTPPAELECLPNTYHEAYSVADIGRLLETEILAV